MNATRSTGSPWTRSLPRPELRWTGCDRRRAACLRVRGRDRTHPGRIRSSARRARRGAALGRRPGPSEVPRSARCLGSTGQHRRPRGGSAFVGAGPPGARARPAGNLRGHARRDADGDGDGDEQSPGRARNPRGAGCRVQGLDRIRLVAARLGAHRRAAGAAERPWAAGDVGLGSVAGG